MIEIKNTLSKFKLIERSIRSKNIILDDTYGTEFQVLVSPYAKIKFILTYIFVRELFLRSDLTYCVKDEQELKYVFTMYENLTDFKTLIRAVKDLYDMDIEVTVNYDDNFCFIPDIVHYQQNKNLDIILKDVEKLKTLIKTTKYCIIIGPERSQHSKYIRIDDTDMYLLNRYQYTTDELKTDNINLLVLLYKDFYLELAFYKETMIDDFVSVTMDEIDDLAVNKQVISVDKIYKNRNFYTDVRNKSLDEMREEILDEVTRLRFKIHTESTTYISLREYSDTYIDVIQPSSIHLTQEDEIIVLQLVDRIG